jgi:SAM-dependent methyltransferase
MTVSDIANLAGVSRATVSNWRSRYKDFPKCLPDSPGRPQFDGTAVRDWLASRDRYRERLSGSGHAAGDVVRSWLYMVDSVQYESASEPLAVLIAAIAEDDISFSPSADERYPVDITVDSMDATLHASEPDAEAIREFLRTELDGIDKADLGKELMREFDNLDRWRRTPDAVTAEQNLHNLIAELVPDDARTVLDFACGTGALLAATSSRHPKTTTIGMERDPVKASVARARLDGRGEAAAIEDVDILQSDPLTGRTFDAVISIPPFGLKVDTVRKERMRSLPYGAVHGSADAAWPQLAAQALTPEGKAFLVLPHNLSVDKRTDHIRRELISRGLLSAVVTLPHNAHPSSKGLDLWVLDRGHERTANVLMVDYSYEDPSAEHGYEPLHCELHDWLGGDFPIRIELEDNLFFYSAENWVDWTEVDPISLLGPKVILDPQYWCVRKATPTSAADLIDKVEEATTKLDDEIHSLGMVEIPDCQRQLRSDLLTMITIREARDEGLIQVIRRTSASKEWQTLTVADAEAIRHGDQPKAKAPEPSLTDQPPEDVVRQGDVLVWATPDRQVRTAICTATSFVPERAITVLRCGANLDPGYAALTLATGRNAVHTTGSTIPKLRVLDLSLPLIPMQRQRQIAGYAQTAHEIAHVARTLVEAAAKFEQALSDAAGSGKVGFAIEDDDL